VSNSSTQKAYIDAKAEAAGIKNLSVVTANIDDWNPGEAQFDRIVTIEMLEHVKNYDRLFERIAMWMRPGAKMFVHIFTHASQPYHFDDGWMAKTFFTGGQMPSSDLLLHVQQQLVITNQWAVNGHNYELTSNRWLENCDANAKRLIELMKETYGKEKGHGKFVEWRLFFLACAECFGMHSGNTWHVSHYLFEKSK
jgi:cyclopropane-fatty-acyl-phospholipid synthase